MSPPASDLPARLLALGLALVRALEGDDLDAAEQLADERARLLVELGGAPPGMLASAAREIHAANSRVVELLDRRVSRLRGELDALATGAAALRGYGAPEPLAPGFIDRRR